MSSPGQARHRGSTRCDPFKSQHDRSSSTARQTCDMKRQWPRLGEPPLSRLLLKRKCLFFLSPKHAIPKRTRSCPHFQNKNNPLPLIKTDHDHSGLGLSRLAVVVVILIINSFQKTIVVFYDAVCLLHTYPPFSVALEPELLAHCITSKQTNDIHEDMFAPRRLDNPWQPSSTSHCNWTTDFRFASHVALVLVSFLPIHPP